MNICYNRSIETARQVKKKLYFSLKDLHQKQQGEGEEQVLLEHFT